MPPQNGDLVYVNETQAAIVLGEGRDEETGEPDGSIIVGTFADSLKVAEGAWASSPGPSSAADRSTDPEPQPGAVVADTPAQTAVPSHEAAAIETAEPIGAGTTDAELGGTSSFAGERERSQDARIAELEAELAATRAATPPGAETTWAAERPGETTPPAGGTSA